MTTQAKHESVAPANAAASVNAERIAHRIVVFEGNALRDIEPCDVFLVSITVSKVENPVGFRGAASTAANRHHFDGSFAGRSYAEAAQKAILHALPGAVKPPTLTPKQARANARAVLIDAAQSAMTLCVTRDDATPWDNPLALISRSTRKLETYQHEADNDAALSLAVHLGYVPLHQYASGLRDAAMHVWGWVQGHVLGSSLNSPSKFNRTLDEVVDALIGAADSPTSFKR